MIQLLMTGWIFALQSILNNVKGLQGNISTKARSFAKASL